jgi:Holliday junction resolvase
MSDIQKIQLIHDLKETFAVDDDYLKPLLEQIEKTKYKENISRFFKGYKCEDLYSYMQGAMPWIKLLHGLDQTQLPNTSKKEYQVPDYSCIFEDAKKNEHHLLIEVKNAGDKQFIELMKKQVNGLLEYSKKLSKPLLFAIYWEKYLTWTHVPIEVFEEKSKHYKLTLIDAVKGDVSSIFGDVSFIIINKIYRKQYFKTQHETEYSGHCHEKYGEIGKVYLSHDGKDFFEINHAESAVIDAVIDMEEIYSPAKRDDFMIEISKGPLCLKLSHWANHYLRVFSLEPKLQHYQFALFTIKDVLEKLDIIYSYPIPGIINKTTTSLYQVAFENTYVWDNFCEAHNTCSCGKKTKNFRKKKGRKILKKINSIK